ncbi:LamG-like jellyroll fold domain-containing protein [Actinomadura miaoliensis]|uniref:LamG domain-containing protein n=1 Tax=Actinomadura miaoliensis TaxID=430685 RepID=A0ABP7W7A2_9ACTN
MIVRRIAVAALLGGALAAVPAQAQADAASGKGRPDVFPSLRHGLVAHYDFEHPVQGAPARERDLGPSGTDIDLVNGGAAMRVPDGAHRGSKGSIQLGQVNPTVPGNDDWKAGIYSESGVPTLRAFNATRGATVLGWFKMTGTNPSPNSNTANPDDKYNATGLAGVLSGNSNGHDVRALLEIIDVQGQQRVVALGRRIDTGNSQTFAAGEDWQKILPLNTWVFLAATFDFDKGTMALYKDGKPLPGFYTRSDDPWAIGSTPGPHTTTATDPRGIKIGGSFPQNTREQNPCNCRIDSVMLLDRPLTAWEIERQYHLVAGK